MEIDSVEGEVETANGEAPSGSDSVRRSAEDTTNMKTPEVPDEIASPGTSSADSGSCNYVSPSEIRPHAKAGPRKATKRKPKNENHGSHRLTCKTTAG